MGLQIKHPPEVSGDGDSVGVSNLMPLIKKAQVPTMRSVRPGHTLITHSGSVVSLIDVYTSRRSLLLPVTSS
jgi:hypothetical protein